jgi:hypothetical protein
MNSNVKIAMKELFEMGFDLFQINGKRVYIRKNSAVSYPEHAPDSQRIMAAFQKLSILTRGLSV